MFEYSRVQQWDLTDIHFEYLRGTYTGRGILKWNPDTGFHLDAFLSRTGEPLPNQIEFGKIRTLKPSEVRHIRMTVADFGVRAVSAPLAIGEHLEVIHHERLTANPPSVLFIHPWPKTPPPATFRGSALFDVGEGVVFPDHLQRDTRINQHPIGQSVSAGAISYEADGIVLRAWLISKTHLKMEWALCAQTWTRTDAWRWAEAAQAALSFLGGRTVQILERSTVRARREFNERRRPEPVTNLGILSLSPRANQTPDVLDKNIFVALIRFFLRGGKEADVARRMCAQMAEAARQSTLAARELLCANILDAALRTLIAGKPYKRSDESTKLEACMEAFRKNYIPHADWKEGCKKVVQTYHGLRHRNAHPDWLAQEAGGLSPAAIEKSLDGMIRLAWFYGYMILAMAGFKDLQPKFPGPHKDWSPLLTFTSGKTE